MHRVPKAQLHFVQVASRRIWFVRELPARTAVRQQNNHCCSSFYDHIKCFYDQLMFVLIRKCIFFVMKSSVDVTQGDSGGPFTVKNSTTSQHDLVGVVSWGDGCAAVGLY